MVFATERQPFEEALAKFVTACDQVQTYVKEFSTLKAPDLAANMAVKRHWRAERTKLHENYYDAKKIPTSVAKTAADVAYNAISNTATVGINLFYIDCELRKSDVVEWDSPFFVPPAAGFEGDTHDLHHRCWASFKALVNCKEVLAATDQIMAAMRASKIRVGRLTAEMLDAFHFHSADDAEASVARTRVAGIKPIVQINASEHWDASLRAQPLRCVPGLTTILEGQFMVVIFPPQCNLDHTNISQYISTGESTLFHKTIAFLAPSGSSFFTPVGYTSLMMSLSQEFIDAILGSDPKAKENVRKLRQPTELIGKYIHHPFFALDRDVAQTPAEIGSCVNYLWHQAATFLPMSWKGHADVKSYWAALAQNETGGAGGTGAAGEAK